jgi:hypothetical protein
VSVGGGLQGRAQQGPVDFTQHVAGQLTGRDTIRQVLAVGEQGDRGVHPQSHPAAGVPDPRPHRHPDPLVRAFRLAAAVVGLGAESYPLSNGKGV